MTYITKEKQMVAEIRHKSRMNTLAFVEEAKKEYDRAIAIHKVTLTKKVDDCVLEGKNRLDADIKAALREIRTYGTDTCEKEAKTMDINNIQSEEDAREIVDEYTKILMAIEDLEDEDLEDEDLEEHIYMMGIVYPDDDYMIAILAAFERFSELAEDRHISEEDRRRLFEIYISRKE